MRSTRPNRIQIRIPAFAALLIALAALSACRKHGPQHASSKPVAMPAVDRSTPETIAASALHCIAAELDAIARGDTVAAEKLHAALLSLADTVAIRQFVAADPRYEALLGDDPVAGMADLWEASVAYYVRGVDYATLRRTAVNGKRASVSVAARGVDDTATIKIVCGQTAAGDWRIERIEPGPAASAAATPAGP